MKKRAAMRSVICGERRESCIIGRLFPIPMLPLGMPWDKKYAGKILMKDSYRMPTEQPLSMPMPKELEEGTMTVEDLMNDYSPRAMEVAEKYLKADEAEYCRMGSGLRQRDDDEEQSMAEHDLER